MCQNQIYHKIKNIKKGIGVKLGSELLPVSDKLGRDKFKPIVVQVVIK
jgi:hypothetical protein